jgi:hypothetical protein
MMKSLFPFLVFLALGFSVKSQDTLWTALDKQRLIDNYIRTQNDVNTETSGLTRAQWNFKETPASWSIAEVLEHLNMWQVVTMDRIRYMLFNGPRPKLAKTAPSDSAATTFIYEEQKHISPDFTLPTGQIPGGSNLGLFNAYCNRIIDNIKNSDVNFRLYFRTFTDGSMTNMNQAHMIQYGHVDRHLRQIRRIKSNSAFPR